MKIETIDHLDLRTLICFDRVAVLGSFAAAGRQLDLPRAAVSRLVQQLESRVGAKLFQRTTRSVALTEEGQALLQAAGPTLATLRSALLEAAAAKSAYRGTVSFSVSQAFGRRFVLPALPSFGRAYPEVRIDLSITDDLDDLVAAGLDFTIRIGELPDSSLISRKLADIDVVLAIPASLLGDRPPPATLSAIAKLPAVGFRVPGTRRLYRWQLEGDGEVRAHAPEGARLMVDSIEDAARLVISGAGISPLPSYLVADAIASGDVVIGLPDHTIPSIPVHICFPSGGARPGRVEALAEHLTKYIRQEASRALTPQIHALR
ncbi:MAG: LysR substrate-binding domain-containing protein [Pseudomonadota bacterium]